MLKQFEATTLEEAYERASVELKCSIVDLHIDIIQYPSKGFLGFFKKTAIIKAKIGKKTSKKEFKTKETKIEIQPIEQEDRKSSSKIVNNAKQLKDEAIFSDFYDKQEDNEPLDTSITLKQEFSDIEQEIKTEVNNLFSHLCYDIEPIEVKIIENNTVYVEFKGKDSALLIGKEGYRYKALSYILFNWINEKYGMMLRLEVAQFLANQEESVYNYLEPVIQTIKDEGYYKTKPLDGILVHIALTKLREEFPNKYVAIKTNHNNEKYIIVNEYRN